jgi:hypothetical protein
MILPGNPILPNLGESVNKNDPSDADCTDGQLDEAKSLSFLARAIVEHRAVVFVGAGASVPVNDIISEDETPRPAWNTLITELNGKADAFLDDDSAGRKYLKRLIYEKKYLEAADVIQDLLDNDLDLELWDSFDTHTQPSTLHLGVARIPFSMAITTNYDRLLEAAYKTEKTVLTWQNPEAILQALQFRRSVILKTHGAIGNGPSIVLAGRRYRDLMYANPRFQQLLKWVFLTRTCLFVGSSLTDPDLAHLFHEAISEYPATFGPHYAILPKSEASNPRCRNLLNSLRIRVIVAQDRDDDGKDTLAQEVTRKLTILSGEVARQTVSNSPPSLPSSDDKLFYLNRALKRVLRAAVRLTGSFRGDICLSPDKIGARMSPELRYEISEGPTDSQVLRKRAVAANSVCGIAYYKAGSKHGVYIPNVQQPKIDEICNIKHYGQIDYLAGHTEINSELALPIEADGVRVGVLNLESRQADAYTVGHTQAAQWFTDKSGRMFAAASERMRRGRILAPERFQEVRDELTKLLRRIWIFRQTAEGKRSQDISVESESLEFVVYQANYFDGKLNAKFGDGILTFGFGDHSLTSRVFGCGRPLVYEDARAAMKKKNMSDKYAEDLEITGSILGLPVFVRGHIAGVVVIWRRKGPNSEMGWPELDLFWRAAHLLANAKRIEGAKNTIDAKYASSGDNYSGDIRTILSLAHKILDGFPETSSPTEDAENSFGEYWRKKVGVPIENLLLSLEKARTERKYEGLPVPRRARLWVEAQAPGDRPEVPAFALAFEANLSGTGCVEFHYLFSGTGRCDPDKLSQECGVVAAQPEELALSDQDAFPSMVLDLAKRLPTEVTICSKGLGTGSSKSRIKNAYLFPNNSYLSFLLSRWHADPFTRVQYPNIFGPDPKRNWLGQKENQPWYVAPILITEDRETTQKIAIVASPENSPKNSRNDHEGDPVQEPDRVCVAYLTLDEGELDEPATVAGKEGLGNFANLNDENQGAQNEMMHLIDFFVSCLVASSAFNELIVLHKADGEEPLKQAGPTPTGPSANRELTSGAA